MSAWAERDQQDDELRAKLRSDIARLAEYFRGSPNDGLSSRDELRWGAKGSFRVYVGGTKKGGWSDFEDGEKGDPLRLIMHERRCSFPEAKDWALAWVGNPERTAAHRREERREKPANGPVSDTSSYAQQIVAASLPTAGTLAEVYLRQHRGIVGPLPTEIRFHAGVWTRETRSTFPALVIPAFDGDVVRRIQVIYLDPRTGTKAALGVVKRTFGKDASHVPANLAAREADGTILAFEGPEDGIGAWSVTGLRTVVAFGGGNLDKVEFPAGAKVIVCGDADEVGRKAAKRTAVALLAAGCSVKVAFPAGAKDFNEVLRRDGAEALQAALVAATPFRLHALPPYYVAPSEPREEALARQRALISTTIREGAQLTTVSREIKARRKEAADAEPDWDELGRGQKAAISRRVKRQVLSEHGLQRLDDAARLLITGSQGSGKTRTAIESVAQIAGDVVVWMTQPTLEKAEEVAADYAAVSGPNSLPALVVRGRGAADPASAKELAMCPRNQVVNRAAVKGVEVRKVICTTCPLRPKPGQPGCGYLQQEHRIAEKGERGVFLMSRAYCFIPSPAPHPDILIADETVIPEAVDTPMVLRPELLRDVVRFRGKDLAQVMATNVTMNRLQEALLTPAPFATLRAAGVTTEALREARKVLDAEMEAQPEVTVSGEMEDEAINHVLDAIEENALGYALATVGAVLREAGKSRDTLTGVVYDPARKVRVGQKDEYQPRLILHRLRAFRGVNKYTTVLLLDGTGSGALNRRLLNGLRNEHIPVERNAHVTGTSGKSYSRQSLTGCDRNGNLIKGKEDSSRKLRAEMAMVAASMPGPVMVGASKQAADLLRHEGVTPYGEDVTHFGRVRGLNLWEDCASALTVGRESISIQNLEAIARAYLASDEEPFVSADVPAPEDWPYQGWPYRATRGRRMRDGSVQPVEVEVHPDVRVQEVLEQIREAELVQTGDRVRPIFNSRHLVFANSLALDMTYDKVLNHTDLVSGGNRFDRAWKTNGVMPLGAADLFAVHRQFFPSEGSAKEALKGTAENGGVSQIIFYLDCPPIFHYRREGQRGRASRVLVDLARHPDPERALVRLLGPMAWVRRDGDAGSDPSKSDAQPQK